MWIAGGGQSVHKPVSSLLVALTGFPTKSLSCLLADTRWRPFIVPAAGPWLGLFASTFGPRYQAALFDRREVSQDFRSKPLPRAPERQPGQAHRLNHIQPYFMVPMAPEGHRYFLLL